MTDLEKDEIYKERLKGNDYNTISQKMSLSPAVIRTFCSRNGLYNTISQKMSLSPAVIRTFCSRNGLTDEIIEKTSECCFCHKQIIQKERGSKRIFCDEKCRSAWRRAHYKLKEPVYHHICAGCGNAFDTVGNKSQRYCSRKCYRKSCGGGVS